MLNLILLLIIGTALVYISKFNFTPVSLNLGFIVFQNIPLFYIIVGSLIFGLVLSYIIHLVQAISTSFTLRGKNSEIKKDKGEILELTKQVHQLELEKEKQNPTDPNAL